MPKPLIKIPAKRPRILCILHYPPPVHGAAMVGYYIQQSKLINEEFDCNYINLSTSQQLDEIGKGGYKKLLAFLKLYFKVIYTVIADRYDFCYLTINSKGRGYYKEMVIVFILKILNYKFIYHYHNKGMNSYKKNWFLDKMHLYQFRNSRVILLSKQLYPDISKYVAEDKVYYCPNGVPILPDLKVDNLNICRAKKKTPELLFLSNMMREKGVFTLLEACRILQSKGIEFRSNFVGSWSDIKEADFNAFILKNNMQGNIFYAGRKNEIEKSDYFKHADIFILPTLNDALPLVILEAMQHGLPVISTDEGAISEVVENNFNGFLIPKDDPETLARRIECLIYDPSLRLMMGRRSLQKFEKRYSLTTFEQNFVSTIRKIVNDFTSLSAAVDN